MLDALSDPLVVFAIGIALVAYLCSTLAAGAALFLPAFPGLLEDTRRFVRRLSVVAALLAAVFSALQFPVRASFLGGSTLDAAFDPTFLGLVAEGPLGMSYLLRAGGIALILALLRDSVMTRRLAVSGAVLVAASFTQIGHTLSEPRVVLMVLLTLHLLAASYWIAALPTLHRVLAAQAPVTAGVIVARFGRIAVWIVGLLVVAGVALAALLLKGIEPLLSKPYGWILLGKVGVVALLAGVAAYNKLKLTGAIEQGSAIAAQRLRVTIRIEMVLVITVLALTAVLTTVTSPHDA